MARMWMSEDNLWDLVLPLYRVVLNLGHQAGKAMPLPTELSC